MKTAVCRIDLGYTRIAGYVLYDSKSLEFEETTPREVEKLVRKNQVNGLTFNADGDIVPDIMDWNLGNMKIRSGVGNYRNFNTDDPRGDTIYSVTKAFEVDGIGQIYEVVNNRCARKLYTKKQLIALCQMAWVGGVLITDDDEVALCEGVIVEDKNNMVAFELGDKVYTKEQLIGAINAEETQADGGDAASDTGGGMEELLTNLGLGESINAQNGTQPFEGDKLPFENNEGFGEGNEPDEVSQAQEVQAAEDVPEVQPDADSTQGDAQAEQVGTEDHQEIDVPTSDAEMISEGNNESAAEENSEADENGGMTSSENGENEAEIEGEQEENFKTYSKSSRNRSSRRKK